MAWRDAKENIGHGSLPMRFGVFASETVEGGNFACTITTDSYLRDGDDAANYLVKGIVPSSVTSVTEGLVSGTHECNVISGITCWMDNDATNPVTIAGDICYVKTSSSVCAVAGSGNTVVAGVALEISATRGVKIFIPAGGYTS